MRGRTLRGIHQSLAHSRAMRLAVGLLTLSLLIPPQLGVAAEPAHIRGG